MSGIVEFLYARLDEAEQVARAAVAGPWTSSVEGRDHVAGDDVIFTDGFTDGGFGEIYIILQPGVRSGQATATQDHIALHDPSRVLIDVEFKREVIRYEQKVRTPTGVAASGVLRALAEVYVDHPDYQQEWAR